MTTTPKETSKWYVAHVAGGREARAQRDFERLSADAPVGEAFVPRRETMRHRNGRWVVEQEVLFPGYLFVDTRDPARAADVLASAPAYSRMLGAGDGFAAVSREEQDAIRGLIGEERVAAMSEGIIEGDIVRVLSGPLRDREATIRKIDRHKRAAYVVMSLLGREVDVKLGLEVVRKSA